VLTRNDEVLEKVLQHELSEACGGEASKTFLNAARFFLWTPCGLKIIKLRFKIKK
jgi:hypothetical protein